MIRVILTKTTGDAMRSANRPRSVGDQTFFYVRFLWSKLLYYNTTSIQGQPSELRKDGSLNGCWVGVC